MTITLGWWVLPLIVSLIGFAISTKFNFESGGSDWFGLNSLFSTLTYLIFFIVPSLIAWLAWALLK